MQSTFGDNQDLSRFQKSILTYLQDYSRYLVSRDVKDVPSQIKVLEQFIHFLINDHLVADIKQVTVAMANSGFFRHYTPAPNTHFSRADLKTILTDFFIFLDKEHGLKNEKVMRGLLRHKNV